MKKICFGLVLVGILAICTQVFADVVTTSRKINQQTPVNVPSVPAQKPTANNANNPVQKKSGSKLVNNIQSCIPYSEKQTYDVGGVNVLYNVKIVGWVNNKCRIDFVSKMDGIASSFSSLYGVSASDAEIFAFTPKIRCEFTKQQLAEVGDSILQEEERLRGARNNMLKNPNSININSLIPTTSSEQKLFNLIMNGSACTMQGDENLNGIMNSIFGY